MKSTHKRTSDQLQEDLKGLEGHLASTTSRDTVMYGGAVLSHELPKAVELLADVVTNSVHSAAEVAEVKPWLEMEIQEMSDKPDFILPDRLHQVAYGSQGLGRSMVPTHQQLERITAEKIHKWISDMYRPERMVFSGYGMEHEELVKLVEKHMGHLKPSADASETIQADSTTSFRGALGGLKNIFSPNTGRLTDTSITNIYRGGQSFEKTQPPDPKAAVSEINPQGPDLAHIYLAFEGPTGTEPDIFPMAVFQQLLGGGGSFSAGGPGKGMLSRLYTSLLNRYGWIESAHCVSNSYSETGLFGIQGSCLPDHALYFLDALAQELARVMHQAPNPEELQRAKNQVRSTVLMALESRMNQVEDIGRQIQQQGYRMPVKELCSRLERVQGEDLVRLANRFFVSQASVLCRGTHADDVEKHWRAILQRHRIGNVNDI